MRAKRAIFTFWVDKSCLKMVNFGDFLKTWNFWSKSVTRLVNFERTKIGGKYQNCKILMRHFGDFQTLCLRLDIINIFLFFFAADIARLPLRVMPQGKLGNSVKIPHLYLRVCLHLPFQMEVQKIHGKKIQISRLAFQIVTLENVTFNKTHLFLFEKLEMFVV